MLERCLIEFCSSTLASIKAASLFNITFLSKEDAEDQIRFWNIQLKIKGVRLLLLRFQGNRALIYVYREKQLASRLNSPEVAEFLHSYGYDDIHLSAALTRLRDRISASRDFPHEIGIFLDYPLGDVRGFIANSGRNFKCVGCWKVYCDECACRKKFAQFRKCRDVYLRLWEQGRSVLQLTVAA